MQRTFWPPELHLSLAITSDGNRPKLQFAPPRIGCTLGIEPTTSRSPIHCLTAGPTIPPSGEGGPGGSPPPPPAPERTEHPAQRKLLGKDPVTPWKCHVVGRKQTKSSLYVQFRGPSPKQHTTNTSQPDELRSQAPSHSPELESPSPSPSELEEPGAVGLGSGNMQTTRVMVFCKAMKIEYA